MSKPKFKLGDKVKIKTNSDVSDLTRYGFPEESIKQIGEVTDLTPFDDLVIVRFQNSRARWRVPVRFLKLVKPEKIIIYRKGAEVVAKNTLTGKTGVAKCNPADEFDFNTGAKLAFERLINPEPVKPKYYSGKVVCIDDSGKGHIKGKIYRVIDGSLEFENGSSTLSKFHSLEEINTRFKSQFIELVE